MVRHIWVVSLLVAMAGLTAACTTTERRYHHHDLSPDSNAAAEHEGYREGVRDSTR